MSLENMQGKLSRVEMKNIKGGCGSLSPCFELFTNGQQQCASGNLDNYQTCMNGVYGSYQDCFNLACGEQPY